MEINIIFATDPIGVIGVKNQEGKFTQPFFCKKDLQFFRNKTINQAVIMGNNTFKAIGKALPNRLNIVITGNQDLWDTVVDDVHFVSSIKHALIRAKNKNFKKCFFIGGAQLIEQVFPFADKVYLTRYNQFARYNGYTNPDDYIQCLPFARADLKLVESDVFVDTDTVTGKTLTGEFQYLKSIFANQV